MNCAEIQKFFSPYLDGELHGAERAAVDVHLQQCPVCRSELNTTRTLVRSLGLMSSPVPPADLSIRITDALMIERAARANVRPRAVGIRFTQWLEPLLMPYTVGAFASLILFVMIIGGLRPHVTALRDLARASEGYDVTKPLTPEGFAADRAPFAVESPSLNPRGALAALAWSPSSGLPGDDDMVVVADVYGNGRASLAAVMEPPRNPRMIEELEDALRKNPAFVPAPLDRRPQTMRVVFVLQKMDVPDQSY